MADSLDLMEEQAGEIKGKPNDSSEYLRAAVSALLGALTVFSTEMNLGVSVLKVDVEPSRIDTSALKPAHVFACVQEHVAKLQAVSASLKKLMKVTAATEAQTVCPKAENNSDPKPKTEDTNVQITASKSEIDRRISAFIERKQLEINENNVREFCNVINCNQENSCARTDAVFTPYPGFKSHVKVTRVVNTYGPQTHTPGGEESCTQKRGVISRDCGNPAIEERLHNIEEHLKLSAAGPVPLSIYQRLKRLEDRILELEGLSPEYFQSMAYLHKRPREARQAYSLTEIDTKINALKASLLKKAAGFHPRDSEEFRF